MPLNKKTCSLFMVNYVSCFFTLQYFPATFTKLLKFGHANISMTMDIYTPPHSGTAEWHCRMARKKHAARSKKTMTFSQIITHFFRSVTARLQHKRQKTHEQNVRESLYGAGEGT
jgi:hypothetical protein